MSGFALSAGRAVTVVDDQARSVEGRAKYGRRDPRQPAPILLVLGDEELLATRAVTDAVATARAVDPDVDVREYQAGALTVGEIAEMLSPSLFGGRRVLVLRAGQDARKDLVTALLAYAKNPDPDVQLVVLHLGGAKGKAFADGLRGGRRDGGAGGEAQGPPRAGRLRPRRDPPGRRPVHRRRRRGAASRPSATTCGSWPPPAPS